MNSVVMAPIKDAPEFGKIMDELKADMALQWERYNADPHKPLY